MNWELLKRAIYYNNRHENKMSSEPKYLARIVTTLIGAICHGILVLARTIDPQTGRSVLFGHKVTALPLSLDRSNYLLNSRLLRRNTIAYSCYVEEEVRACLESPDDFSHGPSILVPYVVSDGNLITSRWSGEEALFSECFADALEQRICAEKE